MLFLAQDTFLSRGLIAPYLLSYGTASRRTRVWDPPHTFRVPPERRPEGLEERLGKRPAFLFKSIKFSVHVDISAGSVHGKHI